MTTPARPSAGPSAGRGVHPIVVTGATGFIGWNLCERLRDAGHPVRAAVRPSSSNPLPEGVLRVDAALHAEQLAASCRGAAAVIHLAGLTRAASYAEFLRVNAEGARQAALAAHAADAFFVLVSSQAAAGPGTADAPAREADPPRPVSEYGRSKLAGEHAVRQIEGLRWAIVRPPAVYGPRDDDFLALFRLARRGIFPLLGQPGTSYTLVHVDDAVEALVAVAAAGVEGRPEVLGETFFIGHPEPIRQIEIGDALAAALDRRVRALRVPRPLLRAAAALGDLQAHLLGRPGLLNRSRYAELTAPGFVCEVSKIERVLGVRARIPHREGFAATAAWYRSRGTL